MAESMLIGFPAGGLEKRVSYRQDKPYTTFDCLNVRPAEVIEGRERGGSRPGLLGPSSRENFGSEIHLLASMSLAPGSGSYGFMFMENYFPGSLLADVWELHEPIFEVQHPLPILSGDGLAGINWTEDNRTVSAVHIITSVDVTRRYTIWMRIEPHEGQISDSYYNIIARVSTVEPNFYVDGLGVDLRVGTPPGYFRFYWRSTVDGTPEDTGTSGNYVWVDDTVGDWFGATFEGNTIVSATFGGVTETINMAHSDHGGSRIGFQNHSDPINPPYSPVWISAFNVEYFSTERAPLLRTLLVTSAGGNLYEEWSARG